MDEEVIQQFVNNVSKNLGTLRNAKTCKLTSWRYEQSKGDVYAVLPPLEHFMGVEEKYIEHNVLSKMETGDVVIGRLLTKNDNGLYMRLLCFDAGKSQQLESLDLDAFCPASQITKKKSHENPVSRFSIGDLIRGEIIECSNVNIVITLYGRKHNQFEYGMISEDMLPIAYSRTLSSSSNYEKMLTNSNGFYNPNCLYQLKENLIQRPMFSFIADLNELTYPSSEFAESLRKKQSSKIAETSVKRGVELCKQGRDIEALHDLNYALELDDSNVHALVARGALYANKLSFTKAIADFELALKYDCENKNAKRYLIEVLITKAKSIESTMEDPDEVKEVMRIYRRVLTFDQGNEEAAASLLKLKSLENSSKNKEQEQNVNFESENKVINEQATINKVKQILEKDFGGVSNKKKRRRSKRSSSSSRGSSPSPRKLSQERSRSRKQSLDGSVKKSKQRRQSRENRRENIRRSFEKSDLNIKSVNKTVRNYTEKPPQNKTITVVSKDTFSSILDQISKFESKR